MGQRYGLAYFNCSAFKSTNVDWSTVQILKYTMSAAHVKFVKSGMYCKLMHVHTVRGNFQGGTYKKTLLVLVGQIGCETGLSLK